MSSIQGFPGPGQIRPDIEAQGAAQAADAGQAAQQAPALTVGSRGPEVKALQEKLAQAGFGAGGAADGIFGPKTAGLVAQFQRAKGLSPTGCADAATLAALDKATAPPPAGAAPANSPTMPTGGKPRTAPVFTQGDAENLPKLTVGDQTVGLEGANQFFPMNQSSRYYAWSNDKGAGGYENEGQGLAVYDTKTGVCRQVLSETFMIDDVQPAKLPDGREALLVSMSDGGAGAPHIAVVDPERGEVFRMSGAKFSGAAKDGKIGIEKVEIDGDKNDKVIGRETLDLAKVASGPTISPPKDEFSSSAHEWDAPKLASKPGTPPKLNQLEEGYANMKIGGKEVNLERGVTNFFPMPDSKRYYSFATQWGSGGFENEGQGLRLYDTKTGKIRDVLSEYAMIDGVKSAKLQDGREALLVSMSDGGAGFPNIAVVDPERGEVFRMQQARFGTAKDGKVTIEQVDFDASGEIKKTGTTSLDLATAMKAAPLVNPRNPVY